MSSVRRRGGIFISYRREETHAYAGRLYDRLCDHFGEDRVFMDVDSIAFGVDFTKAVVEAVSECDILLVLIGRDWLVVTDSEGRRRIDNPNDWVRMEIETALQRDIRVVPVLTDGAVLPQAHDLPQSLQSLIRRQALALSHEGFRSEVARLMSAIDEVLEVGSSPSAKAPKTASLDSIAQDEEWKLELIADLSKGFTYKNVFRLSSGEEVHMITVQFAWRGIIEVDGECIAKGQNVHGKEHFAHALSSSIGSSVTIKATTALLENKIKSLTVRIDDQVLIYKSEK